jgi:hypothetical protein
MLSNDFGILQKKKEEKKRKRKKSKILKALNAKISPQLLTRTKLSLII